MNYGVSFDPDALDQLMALERHLVRVAHPPGLRTSSYKKGVLVAYVVDDRLRNVTVLGIFFGGQDFESLLEGE